MVEVSISRNPFHAYIAEVSMPMHQALIAVVVKKADSIKFYLGVQLINRFMTVISTHRIKEKCKRINFIFD